MDPTRLLPTWILSGLVAWACAQPGPSGIGDPPASLGEVRARLAAPTGVWNPTTEGAVLDAANRDQRVVWAVARLVEYVARRVEAIASGSAGGGLRAHDGALSSVSSALEAVGWVRVACPGADMAVPVTDFSQGEVRADLGAEAAALAEALSGYVRLTLKTCLVEADLLDGVTHALFQPDGVVASMSVSDTVGGQRIGDFAVDALATEAGVEFLVDVGGRTFAIGVSAADAQAGLTVRAANGTWTCRTDGRTTTCDPLR